jgi:hypothetical protein
MQAPVAIQHMVYTVNGQAYADKAAAAEAALALAIAGQPATVKPRA